MSKFQNINFVHLDLCGMKGKDAASFFFVFLNLLLPFIFFFAVVLLVLYMFLVPIHFGNLPRGSGIFRFLVRSFANEAWEAQRNALKSNKK